MIALLYIWAISLAVLFLLSRLLPRELSHLIGKREFAAVALLPAMATLIPSYALFCLAVIAFMALVPANNEQRLRLLIFCLPLLPGFSWIMKVPPPFNQLITINFSLLLLLGCVAVFATLLRSGAKSKLASWNLLFLCLFAGLLISPVKDTSVTNVLRVTLELSLYILLPLWLFSRAALTVRNRGELLLPLLFSAAIIAVVAVFEGQRFWLLYGGMESAFGVDESISAYTKQRGSFLRASATFPEPTSLSLFLALATVMTVSMRTSLRRPALLFVLLGLLGAGQLFTVSRIGLLVTAVGLLAILFWERRHALLATCFVAAPLGWAAMTFVAARVPVLGAALGLTSDAAGSVTYRDLLAERLLEEIAYRPWFGMSGVSIQLRLDDMRQGEGIIDLVNTPLAIAVQSGLVGLFLFLLPSAVLLWRLLTVRSRLDHQDKALASAIFCALIALQAGLLTTSFSGRNQLWMMLLLGLGAGLCAAVAGKRTNRRSEQGLAGPKSASLTASSL